MYEFYLMIKQLNKLVIKVKKCLLGLWRLAECGLLESDAKCTFHPPWACSALGRRPGEPAETDRPNKWLTNFHNHFFFRFFLSTPTLKMPFLATLLFCSCWFERPIAILYVIFGPMASGNRAIRKPLKTTQFYGNFFSSDCSGAINQVGNTGLW